MATDYSELRRLHAEIDTGLWPFKIRALLDALPGLLDEIERMHQADRDEILRVGALSGRIAQLETALKSSECPSCGYHYEVKLWIKGQDALEGKDRA